MSITIHEGFPSREVMDGERPAVRYKWIVIGTELQSVALAMVKGATPATDSATGFTLYRQNIDGAETAPAVFEFTVAYGPRKPPEPGDWSIELDLTGAAQHVTQAKEHIEDYAPQGATAPDHHGAIGVDDQGNVAGCDIVVPTFHWTEKWQLDADDVTEAYVKGLANLIGTTNKKTFRTFTANEVLLMGSTGSRSSKNPDVYEASFKFARQKHVTGLTVGDITGIDKKAWEYLWFRYATQIDGTGNAKIKVRRPISAHVERLYDEADWDALGIGS